MGLIEGKFYYTNKGIEKCHWCNVNGKKELVTPNVKILGQVPDFEHWEATKEDVSYFQGIATREAREHKKQVEEFNETIKSYTEKNIKLKAENKSLQEKLEIAVKALKFYAVGNHYEDNRAYDYYRVLEHGETAEKALAKIKEIK